MFIQQVSVFIENRSGRLENVTQTLKDNDINLSSLSLADTAEYGILRMICSDPEKACAVLKNAGFSAHLTKVVAVKVPHRVGALHELLQSLGAVNIEYMYALWTKDTDAAMILKISDLDTAKDIVQNCGFALIDEIE